MRIAELGDVSVSSWRPDTQHCHTARETTQKRAGEEALVLDVSF